MFLEIKSARVRLIICCWQKGNIMLIDKVLRTGLHFCQLKFDWFSCIKPILLYLQTWMMTKFYIQLYHRIWAKSQLSRSGRVFDGSIKRRIDRHIRAMLPVQSHFHVMVLSALPKATFYEECRICGTVGSFITHCPNGFGISHQARYNMYNWRILCQILK